MRDTKEYLIKDKENLKVQKIKSKNLREQGITLIALVITIIILLILAGVTLNIALSDDGLFNKTKKAVEDYKEAQSEEKEAIRQISTQLYSEYVGATVEGYEPASKEEEVTIEGTTSGVSNGKTDANGNAIANENIQEDGSQTFTEDDEMNWRVWDFDGNILRIIGDPTTATLTLQGAAGYNNGVWAIEKICKTLYSNEAKGAIATNLKRTDIQKVSTYDYTKYKHKGNGDNTWEEVTTNSDDENLIHFGESKTYNEYNQYPKMWNDNDKNWKYEYNKKEKTATGGDEECKKWEVIGTKDDQMTGKMNQGDKSTTFKQSGYIHSYNQSEFIDDAYYDLIFKKATGDLAEPYWLAGRYVHLYESYCDFGLQLVGANSGDSFVAGAALCNSTRFYGWSLACTSPISYHRFSIQWV